MYELGVGESGKMKRRAFRGIAALSVWEGF